MIALLRQVADPGVCEGAQWAGMRRLLSVVLNYRYCGTVDLIHQFISGCRSHRYWNQDLIVEALRPNPIASTFHCRL